MKKPRARKQPCSAKIMHDSTGEAFRCDQLKLLVRAKIISEPDLHPKKITVIPGFTWKPDFIYSMEKRGRVFEDFKGYEYQRFKILKKLWLHHGPGWLRITKMEKGGLVSTWIAGKSG